MIYTPRHNLMSMCLTFVLDRVSLSFWSSKNEEAWRKFEFGFRLAPFHCLFFENCVVVETHISIAMTYGFILWYCRMNGKWKASQSASSILSIIREFDLDVYSLITSFHWLIHRFSLIDSSIDLLIDVGFRSDPSRYEIFVFSWWMNRNSFCYSFVIPSRRKDETFGWKALRRGP